MGHMESLPRGHMVNMVKVVGMVKMADSKTKMRTC